MYARRTLVSQRQFLGRNHVSGETPLSLRGAVGHPCSRKTFAIYFSLIRLTTPNAEIPNVQIMKTRSKTVLAFLKGIPAAISRANTRKRSAEIDVEKMHRNFDITIPRITTEQQNAFNIPDCV